MLYVDDGRWKPIGEIGEVGVSITAPEGFCPGYDVDLLRETQSFSMEFETVELEADAIEGLAPSQDYVICLAVDLTRFIDRRLVRDMRRDFMRKRKIGGTGNHG